MDRPHGAGLLSRAAHCCCCSLPLVVAAAGGYTIAIDIGGFNGVTTGTTNVYHGTRVTRHGKAGASAAAPVSEPEFQAASEVPQGSGAH